MAIASSGSCNAWLGANIIDAKYVKKRLFWNAIAESFRAAFVLRSTVCAPKKPTNMLASLHESLRQQQLLMWRMVERGKEPHPPAIHQEKCIAHLFLSMIALKQYTRAVVASSAAAAGWDLQLMLVYCTTHVLLGSRTQTCKKPAEAVLKLEPSWSR